SRMAVLLILRVLGTSVVQIDRQGCRSRQDSRMAALLILCVLGTSVVQIDRQGFRSKQDSRMAVLLILRVLGTSVVQINRQGCRSKQDSQDGCPTHSPCPRDLWGSDRPAGMPVETGQPGWLSYSFSVSSYLCGFNSLELFDEPAGGAMGVKCSLKADKSRVRVALSDRSLPVIQVRNRLIAAIHKRTEEQR